MHVIGLTGSLGTGKSTVAAMFAKRGAKIIDADAVTRDLLAPGKKCVKKVAKVFPGAILKPIRLTALNWPKLFLIIHENYRSSPTYYIQRLSK